MVTDGRVKELRRLLGMGRTLADSARMAEMSEKAAAVAEEDGSDVSHSGRSLRRRLGRSSGAARNRAEAESQDIIRMVADHSRRPIP